MEHFLEKLARHGGCIISTADCDPIEITHAQAHGNFFTLGNLGFVYRYPEWLAKHSRYARGGEKSCESLETQSAGEGGGKCSDSQ